MMKILKKCWYSWKVWSFIFLLIILMIYKIVSVKTDSSNDYDNIKNRLNNKYNPVRMTDTVPEGVVEEDSNGNKKAEVIFYIKNHSKYDKEVTFLLYQQNSITLEDQLFDLEHVYICFDVNTKTEMENGVITIPGGETMRIHAEGIARDYSKVQISGTSPGVKVINID